MGNARNFYDDACSQRTKEDVVKLYNDWAKTYDSELCKYNYVAPKISAKLFADYLSKTANNSLSLKMIDVGCGTGLVGQALHQIGFTNVDGLDLSVEMLAQAQKRGVYSKLFRVDMTSPGEMPDGPYDAAISVGMFTHNHVGPDGVDKVLEMIKSGGIASITVNADAYVEDGYWAKFDGLVQAGFCTILAEKEEDYIVEHGVRSRIVILQKA